ncbi:PrsW family intramembrane metalloprotease [Catenisphaera adipataccumulans]|jgi:RsiW-degrading membrane proteinase PrsW (M82 family)|uniref:Protease PrsW n=1 Tax=Catenisphaera adipataccumulans TaxID=700500 RepID=A0A7W8FX20_9FIRM|nr:PrsW family glutamic-type intramembrane protease [Catenisphaera adipataccumulans]MBB5182512.1 RsiW-degrading membrane proteinase PrsW (M82 family) [Catenisphaera adipataccumulans]
MRILVAAAVFPAIFLLVEINLMDRKEKEPTWLITRLVLMGIVATFCAIITETQGDYILRHYYSVYSDTYTFLMMFIVVGLSEEGFKFLWMQQATWRSPEFNCLFDGIVYGVSVALGFALFENIMYVVRFGLGTAFLRAVTAVPGHACFGVFMGTLYGLAKRQDYRQNATLSILYRVFAVLVPTILHGIYDYIATVESISILFIAYVIVLFVISVLIVRYVSAHDEYIDYL